MIDLTILLFEDVEKPPHYVDWYLRGLSNCETPATLARVQVLILSQRQTSPGLLRAAASASFPVDIYFAREPMVDGYPVWDVMAETRAVWPLVRGRHVTWNHTEFFWHPGALGRTIAWLAANRPYLALGNLRRFGTKTTAGDCGERTEAAIESKAVSDLITAGDWPALPAALAAAKHRWWTWWTPQQPGSTGAWLEDVFFLDRQFAEAWGLLRHGGEMPFQDVYDLIGEFCTRTFVPYKLNPYVYRLPLADHQQYHLWHAKHWDSFTPPMRDWFFGQPERWRDTSFLRRDLWERLITQRGQMNDHKPVIQLRRGPGGSVTRFACDLSAWLQTGGGQAVLTDWYARWGRKNREV